MALCAPLSTVAESYWQKKWRRLIINFRDLIERYKLGTATQEERQIVEAEIDKNEAINEYLTEQLMPILPHATEGALDSAAETSKIRKRMNRKLAGFAAASVAAVLVLFCIFQFAVLPLINGLYYNPLDGRVNVVGGKEWGQMSIDMSVFSELHLRGYETPFVSVKPEGVGKYDLTVCQYDAFRNYSETQCHSRIVRGKLGQSVLGDVIFRGLGFNWVQPDYGFYTDEEKIGLIDSAARSELPRLPESAAVKAYLFFDEAMDMQGLERFIKESEARVLWAGIKCSDNESLWNGRFGFSPLGKYIPLTNNAYDATQYPLLELDDSEPLGGINSIDFNNLNAAAYETHFISMLKYMAAQKGFINALGFAYDYLGALSYVEKSGIKCHGIVVSGSRGNIERMSEDSLVQYLVIDDVMVSVFSRN